MILALLWIVLNSIADDSNTTYHDIVEQDIAKRPYTQKIAMTKVVQINQENPWVGMARKAYIGQGKRQLLKMDNINFDMAPSQSVRKARSLESESL